LIYELVVGAVAGPLESVAQFFAQAGETGAGSSAAEKILYPALGASPFAAGAVLVIFHLWRQWQKDRAACAAELADARKTHAEEMADREEYHRGVLAAERSAHAAALRAERDAHTAEIARERTDAKALQDRVVEKVIPTLEASMHVVNEARQAFAGRQSSAPVISEEWMQRMERVVARASAIARGADADERWNQGHGRPRGD